MNRNYTLEEKEWLDIKVLFDEEWETFKGISFENQTREEAYRGLGKNYDAVFKGDTGLSIEEFAKRHPSFYTFSEMAEYKLTGKKRNRSKRKRMTKQDKLIYRLKTNLVAEKGLGFSVLSAKTLLELDYRTLWIADCVAWAIVSKNKIEFDNDKERKEIAEANIKTLEQLEQYYTKLKEKSPERYDIEVPDVNLNSREIREMLARPELLNFEIHELVKKFKGTTIERLSRRIIGDDGDSWIQLGQLRNICIVDFAKTGKLSNRNKQPEYYYRFIFDNKESLDFWLSIQLGFFDCRPPSYYKLRGGTQQIIRAVCWTPNPTNIKEIDLFRIANIKGKNISQQRKTLKSYLNEAYKAGFISDGKVEVKKIPKVRKREHWYKIFKIKGLPEK